MLEKLKAKKEAMLDEIVSHEDAIAKLEAKLAIVDELIAEESGDASKAIEETAKYALETHSEQSANKVVTIRI